MNQRFLGETADLPGWERFFVQGWRFRLLESQCCVLLVRAAASHIGSTGRLSLVATNCIVKRILVLQNKQRPWHGSQPLLPPRDALVEFLHHLASLAEPVLGKRSVPG